ncbi:CD63 antigen, partial [Orchesella cincta]
KCCGLAGHSDWADASGAPTVGFIPDSCCLNRFQRAGTCARKITRGNMDDHYFVSKFIYTEGCLNEFDYYYSVDGLGHFAIAMAVFQLFGILLAAGFLWKGSEENGYQNLDENHDDTS